MFTSSRRRSAARGCRSAIPTGFAPDGLPVRVQIVGPWLEDPTPLKLAELIEREFGGFVPPKMFDD
jgi:amidase